MHCRACFLRTVLFTKQLPPRLWFMPVYAKREAKMGANRTIRRHPRRSLRPGKRVIPSESESSTAGPFASTRRNHPKRLEIIQGAIQAIDQFGLSGATVSRITESASVSRGAYLHHFRTKNDLHEAVAVELVSELFREFARSWPDQSDTETEFRALLHAAWDQAFMATQGRVYLELLHAARTDEVLATIMRRPALRAIRLFSWAARRRFQLAESSPMEASDFVRIAQWLLRGMSLDAALSKHPEFFHAQIDLFVDMVGVHLKKAT